MKFPIFLCTILSLGFPAIAQKDTISVHGSDLLDPWVPEYLQSVLKTENDPTEYRFTLRGSYSGKVALTQGYADVCFFLEDKPTEIPEGYEAVLIAYHVIYLYASESFPEHAISKETLLRILAKNHPEPIFSWGDLFPDIAGWDTKQPKILIDPGEKEISLGLFKLRFLDDYEFRDGQDSQVVIGNIHTTFSETDALIYATDEASVDYPGLKQLAIQNFGDSVPFSANEESILYEDYGAVTPIYLILPKAAEWKEKLITHCSSDSFAELLRKNHLFPAH